MSISASINAAFLVNGSTYTANLNIPTSAPSGSAPFLFNVTSQAPTPTGGNAPAPTTLLTVAVGGSGQVYVAVQPPMDVISAVAGNTVQSLDVKVSEGTYNTTTNTFT